MMMVMMMMMMMMIFFGPQVYLSSGLLHLNRLTFALGLFREFSHLGSEPWHQCFP